MNHGIIAQIGTHPTSTIAGDAVRGGLHRFVNHVPKAQVNR